MLKLIENVEQIEGAGALLATLQNRNYSLRIHASFKSRLSHGAMA